MAADLDEEAAGRQVLIIKAVAQQDGTGKTRVHSLHCRFPRGGKTEILPPVRELDRRAIITATDDHHLRGLTAVDSADRCHPGATFRLDGVAVDI